MRTAALLMTVVMALPAAAQRPQTVQARIDSVIERNAADDHPFSLLARPSRLSVKWPEGALHETDVSPPIFLFSRTAALRSFLVQKSHRRWSKCYPWLEAPNEEAQKGGTVPPSWIATGCTFTLLPHFVVRQLSSESAPVQTPTFNPAVDYTWYRLWANGKTGDVLPDIDKTAWLGAFHFRGGHYSNGQSGCFYVSQTKSGDECLHDATLNPPDTLNTTNGSFSTNYAELSGTVGRLGFRRDGTSNRSAMLNAAARWYPPMGMGGMGDELAAIYKRFAWSGRMEVKRVFIVKSHREMLGLSSELECAPGRPTPYKSCRTLTELSLTLPGTYGFGLSWRYATGWDSYNIAFGHNAPSRGAVAIFLQHAQPMFFAQPWTRISRR